MSKYLKTKTGSLESAVLEAVSRAQQAAIAIAKKEKGEKPKNEEKTECPQCEGKGCDHCDGKGYHTTEELTAKQKKIDMNKDGKITGDDLAKLRAKGAKKEEVKEEKDMSEMCCKNCGDMFGKPTAESSCTYDAYDPMGENWIPKEQYESKNKVHEMVEAAAKHITDMWKEAAKVEPKKEEDEPEADGKTMTGKPMSKVKIAPAEGEKEG